MQKCTELDPAKRYQSVEQILIDIDKKFWQHKLKNFFIESLIFSLIIFSVLIFPAKTFDLEPPQENISVEEKVIEQKIEIPQKSEQSKIIFPEIKYPEITQNSSQEIFTIPQNQPKKVQSDPRLNQVCTLLLNNKIFDREIPANVWQNWQNNGEIFYFPDDWSLTLKVENKNNFALNLNISVDFGREEKEFVENISAYQNKNLKIPLGNFAIYNGSFPIKILLNTNDEIIFSWQGNDFGNYKEFTIYLLDFNSWKAQHKAVNQ